MLPLFPEDSPRSRRRPINLGGASSTHASTSLLSDTRTQRALRQEQKRREDAARALQAAWRGRKVRMDVRAEWMRRIEIEGGGGLEGMRCLVGVGMQGAGVWAKAVERAGLENLSRYASSSPVERESWTVLVRQTALILLHAVAHDPLSPETLPVLRVLSSMLSSPSTSRLTMDYLVPRGMYALLAQALRGIPVSQKSSAALPLLVPVLILPLTSSPSPEIAGDFTRHILTTPLLPNRLPLAQLSTFSSALSSYFVSLPTVDTGFVQGLSAEDSVALLANLSVFAPPRYSVLPQPALAALINLLGTLLRSLPPGVLHPISSASKSTRGNIDVNADDSDDDDDKIVVRTVTSFAPSTPPPAPVQVDAKTRTRLNALSSRTHIQSLLSHTSSAQARGALWGLLFALGSDVVSVVPGGVVREIWRGWVRTSPLGSVSNAATLIDQRTKDAWPSLLLLCDVYSGMLRTMGDDEFFASFGPGFASASPSLPAQPSAQTLGARPTGSLGAAMDVDSPTAGGTSAAPEVGRNPLGQDDLTRLARMLMSVAFEMWWRGAEAEFSANSTVPGCGSLSWEDARDRVTKCVNAIHARDSRRAFMPAGTWLMAERMGGEAGGERGFVEAAVYESQMLDDSEEPIATRRAPNKRTLAHLAPRLGVLHALPFAVPFATRVSVFRAFVAADMLRHGATSGGGSSGGGWGLTRDGRGERVRIQVRRGQVAQDGFDRLGGVGVGLKRPVEVTFVDQFGQEEAGIDGGGVFKEFFTSLCKEVFDTDRGLWQANKRNELYPAPNAFATEPHSLNWYRFIGRILGKAMYEGILVDVAFAGFFLAKWLHRSSSLDDLRSLDPELYNGLIFLKRYEGNFEDLSLNFTVTIDEFGVAKTLDLIPNGSTIPVTRENRLQYIHCMSHYRLTSQIKLQSEAFFEGLSEMIDPKWLQMFNQQEVQVLIGGVNSPIDIDDLKENTNYGGLYDAQEATIQAFWNVVESFDHDQRRALLRFVTSCSRPPLLGFRELVPNFAIRDAGTDELRLPTASTCVNLLKLPRYKSEAVLRSKLLQAINANAGFDLS